MFIDPIFGNSSAEKKKNWKWVVHEWKEERLRESLVIQQAVTCKSLKNTI